MKTGKVHTESPARGKKLGTLQAQAARLKGKQYLVVGAQGSASKTINKDK